jgi:hypothetical protein
MKTTPEGAPLRDAADHFAMLRPGDWMDLGVCRVCGVTMGVCGIRLRDGELLILGYSGISGIEAKDFSMQRWNIETGFQPGLFMSWFPAIAFSANIFLRPQNN